MTQGLTSLGGLCHPLSDRRLALAEKKSGIKRGVHLMRAPFLSTASGCSAHGGTRRGIGRAGSVGKVGVTLAPA